MYLEVSLWQKGWLNKRDCSDSLATVIIVCNPKKKPHFSALRKGCTVLVTSSECERIFSVLRRLHNWLTAYMNISRLPSVAWMNNQGDVYVGYDWAIKLILDLHLCVFNKSSLVFWIYHKFFALHIFYNWCNNFQNIFNVPLFFNFFWNRKAINA